MAAFKPPSGARTELEARIQRIVRQASSQSARSVQRAIGPSEIGEECSRRLTYKLLDMPEANTTGDPWPAIVGTATHAWLADAFIRENERLKRDRYLVERQVFLTDGISGTCDVYDTELGGVVDHKVLGTTSLAKVKKVGANERYRVQLHLYGLGYVRDGYDVKTVSLACYPRGGWLDGLYTWTEQYRPDIAHAAMARLSAHTEAAYRLDLENHPERWALIPHQPGPGCAWCPFFRPGSPVSDVGCPGPELGE